MALLSTDNLRTVFAEPGKYEQFRRVCSEAAKGEEISVTMKSGNERRLSLSEMNETARRTFLEICGLDNETVLKKKNRHKALKRHGMELLEVIEEDIDNRISDGYQNSEFFTRFVDMRNVGLGDAQEFNDLTGSFLVVGDYSGNHHDVTMQSIEGESVMVKTTPRYVKIGKDIDLVLLGRVPYSTMVNRIADAFVQSVISTAVASMYDGAAKVQAGDLWQGTGALSSATKPKFDAIIEAVMAANGTNAVIVGTLSALSQLDNLINVSWASNTQKESVASIGRLGNYGPTSIIEAPQRFNFALGAPSQTTYMVDSKKLLILPEFEQGIVKFVDEGESEIVEKSEKGDLMLDFQTYEVNRDYGAGVVMGRYFGVWNLE